MAEVKLTVVCLDDDSFMLKAISRMARRLRPDWNLFFYDNPVTWSEQWSNEKSGHIDIFITDLIMPKIRGDELLKKISVTDSQSIRVLLTGDTTDDLAKLAHDYAHFVIPKPFAHDDFESLFSSAERLHKMPFTLDCRKKLGNFTGLPILPDCVTELKKALKNPDCNAQSLADVISQEPSLVAKLLQIANSPYFGFRRTTDSLTEVVTRLGASLIESVAISMLIHVSSDAVTKEQHQRIASLSLKTASIARLLAKQSGRSLSEQDKVFIAALLSSVGALIMLSYGASEDKIKECVHFQDGFFDHHVIAAYVLILWGYDLQVGEIILQQNNSEFNGCNDVMKLAEIVRVAGQIAVCNNDTEIEEIMDQVSEPIRNVIEENQSLLLSF